VLRHSVVFNDYLGCDVCVLRNSLPIQGVTFTPAPDKFSGRESVRIPI